MSTNRDFMFFHGSIPPADIFIKSGKIVIVTTSLVFMRINSIHFIIYFYCFEEYNEWRVCD